MRVVSEPQTAPPAVREPRHRVLLVAGEASGDLHAAGLIAAIRRILPDAEFWGIGGAGAREQGMTTAVDVAEIAALGLVEVVGKLGGILRAYRMLKRRLREDPPDLVVLIDFPEFNLAVARTAKRFGVPVFYYVSPQVWAWRQGRVRKILRRIDRLAAFFPFEPGVYGNSEKVVFVGHPLVDRVRATSTPAETLARHALDPARPLVTLLPGSRLGEIERMLPEMAGAAERLARARPLQFAIALAPTLSRETARRFLGGRSVQIALVENDTYDLVAASALVLVTSGTATLEVTLLDRPMVIVYRSSPLTWAVARMLVHVPFLGMPNLIAGREIVPELLQGDARAEKIAAAAEAILADPGRQRRMVDDLRSVRGALGAAGAADRAAAVAAGLLRSAA